MALRFRSNQTCVTLPGTNATGLSTWRSGQALSGVAVPYAPVTMYYAAAGLASAASSVKATTIRIAAPAPLVAAGTFVQNNQFQTSVAAPNATAPGVGYGATYGTTIPRYKIKFRSGTTQSALVGANGAGFERWRSGQSLSAVGYPFFSSIGVDAAACIATAKNPSVLLSAPIDKAVATSVANQFGANCRQSVFLADQATLSEAITSIVVAPRSISETVATTTDTVQRQSSVVQDVADIILTLWG